MRQPHHTPLPAAAVREPLAHLSPAPHASAAPHPTPSRDRQGALGAPFSSAACVSHTTPHSEPRPSGTAWRALPQHHLGGLPARPLKHAPAHPAGIDIAIFYLAVSFAANIRLYLLTVFHQS